MAKIIWIGISPAHNIVKDVVLYDHALNHAKAGHPEIVPYIGRIGETIQSPTSIHLSHTRPSDTVVFFNDRVVDLTGQILTIPVKITPTESVITSVYFRLEYRGGALWTP